MSEKTSVCSALLGQVDTQQGQKTVTCIKSEGQLRGEKLTVVDTPGWWKDLPLIDTAERIKQELQLSVRHCPPGPHAFILTIEVNSFLEKNRRSVEEHLALFGEKVWEFIIVVFTRAELLQGKSIEQHIESEGNALKWIIGKCGNRYCVFYKQNKFQNFFIQLLQNIDSIVEGKRGRHFELDENILRDVKEKKRAAQERAKERQQKVKKIRTQLRETGQIQLLSEVRIVILGWVVCGKTFAKNIILNQEDPGIKNRTAQCTKETASVCDRLVTVVDTPGWWKYFSELYTPERVKTELAQSITLGSKAPHALLLVVPADVSFLEEQRKTIEDNMKMFGEMAWRHTLVLFTWGDNLGNTSIEEHIENEGEPLTRLVEKCGNRYHVFNNINRGDGSQVYQLLEKIDEMEASASSCGLLHKALETTQSHRQAEEVRPEMVEYLEKEWSRRDKEQEEKIKTMWQETFSAKSRNSLDRFILLPKEVPTQTENKFQLHLPQTQCSSTLMSSGDYQQHHDVHQDTEEKFEREWIRYKAVILDKIWAYLYRQLYTSCDVAGLAEHEPSDHGKDINMQVIAQEWVHHEAVVMEKAQGIMSVISSQSKVAHDMEMEQSREKVLNWKTTTSGLGSDLGEEDNSFAE